MRVDVEDPRCRIEQIVVDREGIGQELGDECLVQAVHLAHVVRPARRRKDAPRLALGPHPRLARRLALDDFGQIEPPLPEVRHKPLDTVVLRPRALTRPRKLDDLERILVALHFELEVFQIALQPIPFIAHLDRQHARLAHPAPAQAAHDGPSVVQLHPVVVPVEQVQVPRMIDAQDSDRRVIRPPLPAACRVDQDVDVQRRRAHVDEFEPCLVEHGLGAGGRIQ